MSWYNAVYGGGGVGLRNIINAYTAPNNSTSLSVTNNGKLFLSVTDNLGNDRNFGGMGLYTTNINAKSYWVNTKEIDIQSTANKLGAIGAIIGGVISSAESHASNTGTIKIRGSGAVSLFGLYISSTRAQSGTNSTFTNSGLIELDNQNPNAETVGVALEIAGTNVDATASSTTFENSGTVKINNSSSQAKNISLDGQQRNSRFNLKNSGKILAATQDDTSIYASANAVLNNSVLVNIENTNEIFGKIIAENTTDALKQTSGSIRGDISLGSGNDTLEATGGLLTGKILMGDGDDEVKLGDTINISAVPQIDGGLGTDTLNVTNMTIRGFTAASNDGTGNLNETNNINVTGWEKINLNNSRFTLTGNAFASTNTGVLTLSNDAVLGIDSSKTSPTTIYGETSSTNSTITLNTNRLGDVLTLDGNYSATNGKLLVETEMGGDNSATDKLIISGRATGKTQLVVKNINGRGAATDQGIQVIQTGQSEANDTFFLAGNYVSAGAYDYSLNLRQKNTAKNNSNFDNWYLESRLSQTNPTAQPTQPTQRVYSPNVGSYIANELAGNFLFNTRLEDREGASRYQDLEKKQNNVWMRAYGSHQKFDSVSDQLNTKGNSFVYQLGIGLIKPSPNNQFNIGLMGGYGTYKGDTYSNLTDRKSSSKVSGYSIGVYGTWYANPDDQRGAYIDSWILWNHFKNKVTTADKDQLNYNSSGITASIEVGNNYLFNDYGNKTLWIQPQAQLTYQGVHAHNFKDSQAVPIKHGDSNIQARLGVKTYLEIPTDSNRLTSYRPYIALNYIHNFKPHSIRINDVNYEAEGNKNLGEVKLGLEGKITKNSQIWINAGYLFGKSSYQSYQGNIGWQYNF
ncbi:autotransporter outer membrane beta-barrel domain-containing protein [Pusillimonas sp. T2]|uniref:autotransporter family protein n=1 Tax=Pusillimonas sp. T2 TaxID=1548123 RepID=UPI00130316B6|nr:autotransporter outer membrane beta-barrel domain-containing protein [Pusillimonas sp. T2]